MQIGDRVRCIRQFGYDRERGIVGDYYMVNWINERRSGFRANGLIGTNAAERFVVDNPPAVAVPVAAPAPQPRGRPVVFYTQVMEDPEEEREYVISDIDSGNLTELVADADRWDGHVKVGRPKKITVYV